MFGARTATSITIMVDAMGLKPVAVLNALFASVRKERETELGPHIVTIHSPRLRKKGTW